VCHPAYQPGEEDSLVEDMETHLRELTTEKPHIEMTFDCASMLKTVEGVSSIVPTGNIDSDVKLEITQVPKKKEIKCRVESSVGEADAKLSVGKLTSRKDVAIGISTKYFLEFLFLIQKGDVVLHVWSGHIMLRSEEKDTVFVMPQLS
jgi:hypothetical protein